MEEQIKKTAARVRTTFAYFWMLPILLVLLGETGGGWVGMYAGDVRVTYMAETVTILLAASCVPIALKLFSWVLIRKIDVVTLPRSPPPLCAVEWRAAGIACHTGACRLFHLLYHVEQYGCTVCTDRTDGFSVLPTG